MFLDHPGTRKLIDFGQPLAVLLVAVLHFISDDDDPSAIVGMDHALITGVAGFIGSHLAADLLRQGRTAVRGRRRRHELRRHRQDPGRRAV